jgi:hypothetical protein
MSAGQEDDDADGTRYAPRNTLVHESVSAKQPINQAKQPTGRTKVRCVRAPFGIQWWHTRTMYMTVRSAAAAAAAAAMLLR